MKVEMKGVAIEKVTDYYIINGAEMHGLLVQERAHVARCRFNRKKK